ncbi:hypothetical protein IFM89_015640 [Coptis chinensis]|uniref:Replication factor A C-terminal domain-containing protein n=1 Tax=Coptis chinensis TaxID=261450 RepID=A0A835ITN7_9MAGN|nr:hypothetical protein IFM89_015640 [Coptis chinensis]
MAEKGYKRIKEINDTNGNYRIKVRVSIIWEATDFNTDKIKSLDMVLIDEHELFYSGNYLGYILKFDIEDNTAHLQRATAFEEVASTLMKKSAAELIAMDSKENGTEFAEKEFRKLIGHTAIFQIRVTKFNKERNNNSLTISKVFSLHNDYYNGEENPKISHRSKVHLYGSVTTITEDSNEREDDQPPNKKVCKTSEDKQD